MGQSRLLHTQAAGFIINTSSIKNSIAQVELLLKDDTQVSPALRSVITLLLVVLNLLLTRLGLDSHNSSKPPAGDPHRERKRRMPSDRKPGGQLNHPGTTILFGRGWRQLNSYVYSSYPRTS